MTDYLKMVNYARENTKKQEELKLDLRNWAWPRNYWQLAWERMEKIDLDPDNK